VIAVIQDGECFHFSYEIFAKIDEAACDCAPLPGRFRQSMGIITGLRWRRLGAIKLREGQNENTFRASVKKGYAPLHNGGDSALIRKSDKSERFHAPC